MEAGKEREKLKRIGRYKKKKRTRKGATGKGDSWGRKSRKLSHLNGNQR